MAETHPGDQGTTTIHGFEIFSSGRRGGDDISPADLDCMARAARECGFDAPLRLSAGSPTALLRPEGHPAFGYLKNLRREGVRLLADVQHVPRKIAAAIRGNGYSRIATQIARNVTSERGRFPMLITGVTLYGGTLPAIDTLADLEKLYSTQHGADVRLYHGRILPRQDGDQLLTPALPDEARSSDGRSVRHEESTMPIKYEDLPVEDQCAVTRQLVDHQVRRYMQTHGGVGYAEALAATLQADPDLKHRYAASWIPLPATDAPTAGGASEPLRRAAGAEVVTRAKVWLAEHPGHGKTIEDAVRVVLAADAGLAKRYLGLP